jgi:hypothetical protein
MIDDKTGEVLRLVSESELEILANGKRLKLAINSDPYFRTGNYFNSGQAL